MKTTSKNPVLVVIPAFNEQDRIGHVITDIRKVEVPMDIAVIDDGSRDTTALVAKLNGAKVIRLSSHLGYGAALQTGYKYAYQQGYDFVVQLDGDGQHDPSYIPELLKVVMSGGADLVLGSRFLERSAQTKQPSNHYAPGVLRKLGIKLFAWLTSLLVGFKITDPTSGYQALNRRLITFFIRDFFPSDYPDADVILIAHRAGFVIKEAPIVSYERDIGKSMHRGLKPAYYTFKMFLSIFMTMLRKKPEFLRKQRDFKKKFGCSQSDAPHSSVS
ncbi:MAG: glycosyltransferase family 2 protein [Deltaproteobacteria bacterium]|nr:glycosyltransferase family 2 protein [Deltaproteobacteria bacterium]